MTNASEAAAQGGFPQLARGIEASPSAALL
jgi:hypothetical protein